VAVADSTEKQLAWEARQRPRAAAAAIVAALLTFGAGLWSTIVLRDIPTSGFLESLQNAQRPGSIGPTPSLRLRSYEYLHSHVAPILAFSILMAIGLVALGWAVTFLAAATRARRPEMPRFALYLTLVGAGLGAVGTLLRWIATLVSASDFLGGAHTVDAAVDAAGGSALVAAAFIQFFGGFILAAGLVLVSLNAMRAGLLTRFMGIFGVIVGALQILAPSILAIVQATWLVALGALMLGRWGSGVPPAWGSGRAEPWPSQAEVAQRRRDAAQAGRGGRAKPAAPETPQAAKRPATVGAPAKRKRKRKR
jgi:hypothetical protein